MAKETEHFIKSVMSMKELGVFRAICPAWGVSEESLSWLKNAENILQDRDFLSSAFSTSELHNIVNWNIFQFAFVSLFP